MQHLDELLSINELDAIEWTPQAGLEPGPNKRWWDMYHRILDAGKSLQVIDVQLEGDVPALLDEFGGNGLYMLCSVDGRNQEILEAGGLPPVLEHLEKYR